MARASAIPSLPLPHDWPATVKAAVVHVVSVATLALTRARGDCANSPIARARLRGEVDRLRAEVAMLREEIRIKDARMARIAPARRPQYEPADRLAILALRAARGWNLAQTARALLVSDATVASWMRRLDEQGEDALVQTKEPVNRFPDFVRIIVQCLKVVAPLMGRRKLADTLARAGLHLGASTVRRMLRSRWPKQAPKAPPAGASDGDQRAVEEGKAEQAPKKKRRVVSAKYPGHLWHVDLTVVPTLAGFWVPWVCYALPQSWPFGWRVLVVLDHFSRAVVGTEVFAKEPTGDETVAALERIVAAGRGPPKYVVPDQGAQFQGEWRAWCARRGIKPRFGAISKHGSIAVVERYIVQRAI